MQFFGFLKKLALALSNQQIGKPEIFHSLANHPSPYKNGGDTVVVITVCLTLSLDKQVGRWMMDDGPSQMERPLWDTRAPALALIGSVTLSAIAHSVADGLNIGG